MAFQLDLSAESITFIKNKCVEIKWKHEVNSLTVLIANTFQVTMQTALLLLTCFRGRPIKALEDLVPGERFELDEEEYTVININEEEESMFVQQKDADEADEWSRDGQLVNIIG